MAVWGSLIALGLFVGWAYHAEIDQITRGQGQIIASSRTQIIQAPDGGVLEELLVREGTEVQRGELLARLDRTKVEAGYREAESKLGALSATVSRLRAEVFGGSPRFDGKSDSFPAFRQNQVNLLEKRRASLSQEIAAIERMKGLAMRELAMTEPLLAAGDVSMGEVLRLQRQVADLEGQISNRENKYLQDVQAELNKAEEELSSARELLVQRQDQLTNTELRAPVNGTVKNVRVTTRGGVLRAGDELMQIVPVEDNLIVEAKVKPSDVAFLKPGLDVSVKIDAYDYTIYGSLPGKLTYISADTMSEDLKQGEQAYYRVQVKTDSVKFNRKSEENLSLQPGMTASIEVKTGHNTVLMYLLKPIVKTLNDSLGER
ncbi:HlyD family type I secretion periplasmic adaptor subunit [Hydrogenophaga sp.]|uniref:HlyD family type I secretion periplasmic adaptor subunit n=1 Tax=Hydrogenophaga sp. TaxID=1904254 RepID=UPI0025C3AC6F|nr:HlyD family type I secretion periplasmic adaptor subunit [Hydrogenophaga sp.]